MSEPQRLPSDTWYKNQLQEYTQKASMGLPVYKSVCEGPSHAPQFRSLVWIDGSCFTTPQTFPNRKNAEQEAAKLALMGIREKVKNEGSSLVLADIVFCKSIINEYAVKMNLGAPSYETKESKAILPVFMSTLVLNGVSYCGDAGKNKKEAEQLAARSAIVSILDSEPGSTMSEIVRSKFKLYDALKNGKDSFNVQDGNLPAAAKALEESGALLSVNKRKEPCAGEVTDTAQIVPVPEPSPYAQFPNIQPPLPPSASEQCPIDQAAFQPSPIQPIAQLALEQHSTDQGAVQPEAIQPIVQSSLEQQPIHEFKRLKPQPPSETINLPIVFVPPTSGQALECSAAARKRRRRKERKRAQLMASSANVMATQNPATNCSSSQ